MFEHFLAFSHGLPFATRVCSQHDMNGETTMRKSRCTNLLLTTAVCASMVMTSAGPAFAAQRDARIDTSRTAVTREAYDTGYREGLQRGERDGRDRRAFGFERDDAYRSGERGYDRRFGTRERYRVDFRRGFEAGYRAGYDRVRVNARDDRRNDRRNDRQDWRVPRGFQEPAAARGYSDGYEQGLEDGDDRDRYDPVRHSDYREGDQGYQRDYGSKDAYKNNYRAGFRQGYEDGYRAGARR
jgi:flagellar biosynthesis/type III secretory pathway protein FliH